MDNNKYVPGEQVPASGSYASYDKNGQCGGSAYLERGKRFPATQHSGSYYMLED